MSDNQDKKFKDMEPKKDAKGGGGIHHGPSHEHGKNPPSGAQGTRPPSGAQGHGGPKAGN